jgi:hypothetical protein
VKSPDGRDGAWRVQHEQQVLRCLLSPGSCVACLFVILNWRKLLFDQQFIEGRTSRWLAGKRRRLPVRAVMELSLQLAEIMNGIHAAGCVA